MVTSYIFTPEHGGKMEAADLGTALDVGYAVLNPILEELAQEW